MVSAGTGKEGKTKEVVKDRVCMYVGMHACMYACMYASDDDDIEERYLAAEVLNTNVAGCQCNYGRHDTVTVTCSCG